MQMVHLELKVTHGQGKTFTSHTLQGLTVHFRIRTLAFLWIPALEGRHESLRHGTYECPTAQGALQIIFFCLYSCFSAVHTLCGAVILTGW